MSLLARVLTIALLGVAIVAGLAYAVVQGDDGGDLAAARTTGERATAKTDTACPALTAGDHLVRVEDDRAPVLLHVPPRAGTDRRPLVVVLPGATMTGRSMADYTGYSRLADRGGFLVAYPTASGDRAFWNVSGSQPGKPDDVAYLRHVIGQLTSSAACGDPARVGMTGVSNGGGMTALMACQAADLLAAAAPVAGGYSTLPDCHPSRPLPILEIHGLRDGVVPYGGKAPDHAGAVAPYVAAWRRRDRCAPSATQSAPASNVQELAWRCADGRRVVHARVVDAEHGWPGEDDLRPFSSTMRTWRFFSRFVNERFG